MMGNLKSEEEILHKFRKYVGSQVRVGIEFIFRGFMHGVTYNAEEGAFESYQLDNPFKLTYRQKPFRDQET